MILNNDEWEQVNQKCGCDVLDIVMDLVHGRVDAPKTADRIAGRCNLVAEMVASKISAPQHEIAVKENTKPLSAAEIAELRRLHNDALCGGPMELHILRVAMGTNAAELLATADREQKLREALFNLLAVAEEMHEMMDWVGTGSTAGGEAERIAYAERIEKTKAALAETEVQK